MTPEPRRSGQIEQVMRAAAELAAARGHGVVGTEHLLLALVRAEPDSFARRLLDEMGATDELRRRIEAAIGESPPLDQA